MDIAKIRDDVGLTQAQLAEQLGISPGHMGDIERGHRRLTIKLAAKMERVTKRKGIVKSVVDEQSSTAG